jgi:hypothetical protein
MKRLLWLGLAWIGASAVLLAAGFWDKKDFMEWSDKEVARIMKDSPWSRETSIAVMGRASFSRAGGDAGGDASESGLPGRGGRGRGGGGGLGDSELARPAVALQVRWASALPVKQALIRSAMSAEQQMDERAQQFLDRVEPYYVITVSGISRRMLGAAEGTERFVEASRIERGKDRARLVPEKVQAEPEQNRVTLYFFFPRTDPITLDDKNAEFVLKAKGLELKRKFKLQDMMYRGKLEL